MAKDLTFDKDLTSDNKIILDSINIKDQNIKNKTTETCYNILMIDKRVNASRLS